MSLRFAWRISSSSARWFEEPLPAEATDRPPFLVLESSTNSLYVVTGVFGATVRTMGTDWIGPIIVKSRLGS